VAAYRGWGTWVDVYDWTRKYTDNKPTVGVADVDRMADVGVQTVYIQSSTWEAPGDLIETDLLMPMIARAHERGMRVISWYLPTLEDPNNDMRRLAAISQLPVEGIAVDIESRKVTDVAERNRRLLALSATLRQYLPGRTLGAIVLPPVVMEVVNPNYWPGFPWSQLAPYYDVWLPMSYWTNRTSASGYRDGYRYTTEDIVRLRNNLGQPGALVHTIGGIASECTPSDVDGMVRAAAQQGVIGGSLYDWHTTGPDLMPHLFPLRA
jgi:hypothetical protein